jgi:hypothetical protein
VTAGPGQTALVGWTILLACAQDACAEYFGATPRGMMTSSARTIFVAAVLTVLIEEE